MIEYKEKTKSFPHQEKFFNTSKDKMVQGILWDPGCGKTKVCIDLAAYLFLQKKIDTLLIVAPNNVHRNWIFDELPKHLDDKILSNAYMYYFDSKKAKNISDKRKRTQVVNYEGLSVVAISYNGIMTTLGRMFLERVLKKRECLYVLDESHYIKTPGAKRTKHVLASGAKAKYKRILTGTPVIQAAFDVYSQIKFLDKDFWKRLGFGDFYSFKHYFGTWSNRNDYEVLENYRNLDKLNNYIELICDRLTKEDAGLSLPPKLYSKRYFDMLPSQKRLYCDLKENFIVELANNKTFDVSLAMVRLLRLQQITCGYLSDDENIYRIDDKNPRLEVLKDICNELNHPAIIWARFTEDVSQIIDFLGEKACRYDGKVDDDIKEKSKHDFQSGLKQFFVGTPSTGCEGITLCNAKTVIYYSNSFSLRERIQSEDRAHRIGQTSSVHYIDIVCPFTVDEHIADALRKKLDIACQVTGDNLTDWI